MFVEDDDYVACMMNTLEDEGCSAEHAVEVAGEQFAAMLAAMDDAYKAGIRIGICGELGADLTMLETFLSIGIDELSVSPSSVLPLRAEIRKSTAKTCTLKKLEC